MGFSNMFWIVEQLPLEEKAQEKTNVPLQQINSGVFRNIQIHLKMLASGIL